MIFLEISTYLILSPLVALRIAYTPLPTSVLCLLLFVLLKSILSSLAIFAMIFSANQLFDDKPQVLTKYFMEVISLRGIPSQFLIS